MNRGFFLFLLTVLPLLATAYPNLFLTDEIEQQMRDQVEQDDKSRIEQDADLFEGDIDMDPSELEALTSPESDAIRFKFKRWKGARMYYNFHSSISSSAKSMIYRAIGHIQLHTCVRFSYYTPPKGWFKKKRHYAQFYRGKGCSSKIGRNILIKKQKISLGPGCDTKLGTVVHEIMHALGFFHEQSRRDRDKYVAIHWSQIQKGKSGNFKKYSRLIGKNLGTPYDYNSVMHYGRYSFAKSSKPTITPKKASAVIGQRDGMSYYDAKQINILYGCKAHLKCRDKAHPFACAKVKNQCSSSSQVRADCQRTCGKC